MSTLRARFNRMFAGGNLELVRFSFYLLFPIGFMYYFGIGLEEDIEKQYIAQLKREEERKNMPQTDEEWARLLVQGREAKLQNMKNRIMMQELRNRPAGTSDSQSN
ncbi:hypothetical protein V1525DRAFT_398583 [Lipomyces kononenkoae]|uniref:Uncharacterized protein n=1 Tax=Lipomyces kononenkoae TaxID=34357 RepID=A0ACC3T7D8_LIPKO